MKVLLSGYYGFDNTGDEAILLAITRELKAMGHEPMVLSNNPEQTEAFTGSKAFPRMKPQGLLPALLKCDVLLSGGGGLLQDKTSSRNLTYYLTVIQTARMFGKRVAVFNQSIGPLTEEGKKRIQGPLQRTVNIVRDQKSKGLLDSLGLKSHLGGDPALLLQPSKTLPRDPNRVVIAPRGDETDITDRLKPVVRDLTARGFKVQVISFHPHVDDVAARALQQAGQNVEVLSTSDPQLALDHISAAGHVIGVRLHAVILAAAARVKFTGIHYDPKVEGFCADALMPTFPRDFNPADVLNVVIRDTQPDWSGVEAMTVRARDSFKVAVEG